MLFIMYSKIYNIPVTIAMVIETLLVCLIFLNYHIFTKKIYRMFNKNIILYVTNKKTVN